MRKRATEIYDTEANDMPHRAADGRIYWAVYSNRSAVRRHQVRAIVVAATEDDARAAAARSDPRLANDETIVAPAKLVQVMLATGRAPLSRGIDLIEG